MNAIPGRSRPGEDDAMQEGQSTDLESGRLILEPIAVGDVEFLRLKVDWDLTCRPSAFYMLVMADELLKAFVVPIAVSCLRIMPKAEHRR